MGRSTSGPIIFFQSKASLDAVAFEIISSREAKKRWAHRGQFLHEINAVPINPIVVGGREQRNELEPQSRRLINRQLQMVLGGSATAFPDRISKLYSFQFVSATENGRLRKNLPGLVRHKGHTNG